jgi:hypothetical protein
VPSSSYLPLTIALAHVERLQPTSVLDVGAGFGKWGFLIREQLDFLPGRYEKSEWHTRIHGVDAFPASSPLIDWVYDEFTIGDVLMLSDEALGRYDLVVVGDVIEHLERSAGEALIERLRNLNGCIIVNTPRFFFEQEPLLGNEYEIHRSHWRPEDFERWPADVDVVGGIITAAISGVGGGYPSDTAIRASRLVRRIPAVRSTTALATSMKTAFARLAALKSPADQ